MGFLDRMISDLIQDNTGINARRMVRKIGGGKILALGGAALAAGMFAEKQGMFGRGGQSTSAPPPPGAPSSPPGAPPVPGQRAAPPPLPGSRPAAPPPPLPPAATASATAGELEDELPQELTYAIVRTMVAAALADGNLAASEKAIIQKHLGESGLSDEQTAQVHKDLVLPPSPEELAALTGDAPAREVLYRFGALVALADQDVSDLERQWLEHLATAFEITGDRKTALEAEIFRDDGD